MRNYFNYFTEIEERFQQRRGSLLFLSTLDWALVESWREAGVPLEAVLRGIDATFDKRETSKSSGRRRRVNGLAWCAQAVMEEAQAIEEASLGVAKPAQDAGFEPDRIAAHLLLCARLLHQVAVSEPAHALVQETVARLQALATEVLQRKTSLEELEGSLRVMEEKLLSMLLATEPEAALVHLREEAARELAPYRNRMQALQIRQIEQQFLHKRLLERYQIPRLSLFYMSQV